MSETLLGLVPTYGATLLAVVTFLSCLAVPMPASLAMLAAGAFSATGDLNLLGVSAAALAGALLGDQVGFVLGSRVETLLAGHTKAHALMTKARELIGRRPGLSIYFTRWLLSPLGPYANVVAGASQMNWLRFTLWDLAGEVTWVSIYVGLGYGFGTQYERIAGLTSNLTGMLAAGVIAYLLLRRLFAREGKGNTTPNLT
jgi:membrane protein DedA with SNARE-associated domain